MHSKRELVVEILFFLFTGAPREKKTRGGAETVWSFIFTGERAKKKKPKRLKCI